MSNENYNILNLRIYKRKKKVPFVIYADTECLLEPIISTPTTAYQKHVPTNAAYYLQCNFDDSLGEIYIYRREDCIQWFVNNLKSITEKVDFYLQNIAPMESLTQK